MTEPAGPLVVTHLPPTQRMRDAFDGTAHIHYFRIKKKPWTHRFTYVTISDSATSAKGSEQSKVIVNSTVTFERKFNKPLANPGGKGVNKIGALLIDQGFLGLDAQGPPDGPPVGASGNPETVIVPGLGPGEISLDVQATVMPKKNRDARAAAGTGLLLASASALVRSGGRPVTLTILPTAAGHQLLTRPHGVIEARYVYGFRPRGSSTTYHAEQTFTIPAN